MFISKLHIKQFRIFSNNDIKFGKYITAITGFNATGKSTILGLLGHCGELKKNKPFLRSAFKAELGEILKFSEAHDPQIRDIGKIEFANVLPTSTTNYPASLLYRSTWQKYRDGRRYRILPKRTDEWPSSSKIKWPTLRWTPLLGQDRGDIKIGSCYPQGV